MRHSIEMMKHEMSEKEAHFTLKNKELETRLRAQELLFDQVSSEKQTIEHEKAEITATLNKLRDERDEYLAQISELVGEKNNSQERTTTTIERLQKELQGIQMSLDMLYTKNNSLEGLDITEGGGSVDDQREYQRLDNAQRSIVAEINKRHMLSEIQ